MTKNHNFDNSKISYKYHNPSKVAGLADQQDGNGVPFGLDFYIVSGTSNVDAKYKETFVKNYKDSAWFVLRKAYASSSIEKTFMEKMNNMEQVVKETEEIHEQYREKCALRKH